MKLSTFAITILLLITLAALAQFVGRDTHAQPASQSPPSAMTLHAILPGELSGSAR